MSDLAMFLGTVLGGGILLLILPILLPAIDEATLRAGLWLNAVDRKQADRIIQWRKTGKFPF